jgi:predicted glycosyltransferase
MRILIDIGHPAHVHYFKNFIDIMKRKNHQFLIVAKDKNVTHTLLAYYNIPFIKRRNYPKCIWGKLVQIPVTDLFVLRNALSFKPDILVGFSGTHISHVAWLMGRPSIVFDDTEHAKLAHASYRPFATHIITPSCFKKDMGEKQLRFNSYMELCALHPNYFESDGSIRKLLNLAEGEKYIILRFVLWSASHDIGHQGLSLETKKKVVKELVKYAKVFISSEGELPDDLKQYQIKIPPERVHDALAYASLYVGEGATMASECAMLGTPAIYVNSLSAGTLEEQEEYGLLYGFRNSDGVLEKALELITLQDLREKWQARRRKMLLEKIDTTAFMVWFIENYPDSANIMKKSPEKWIRD